MLEVRHSAAVEWCFQKFAAQHRRQYSAAQPLNGPFYGFFCGFILCSYRPRTADHTHTQFLQIRKVMHHLTPNTAVDIRMIKH